MQERKRGAIGSLLRSVFPSSPVNRGAKKEADPAIVLIDGGEITSIVTSLDLRWGATANYAKIIIDLFNFRPVNDSTRLIGQIADTDGGAFLTATYTTELNHQFNAVSGEGSDGAAMTLSPTSLGGLVNEGVSGRLEVIAPLAQSPSHRPMFIWRGFALTNVSATRTFMESLTKHNTALQCTGIRFLMETGNIAGGKWRLQGVL